MRYLASLLCCLLLLPACTSTFGNADIQNPQLISQIQRGRSTKQDITRLLGEPQRRSMTAAGVETWHYNYSKTKLDNATFIPIYGIFAGGAKSESSELMVEFANGQTVSNYTTTEGNYHYKNFQ
jgi:outer membrane protein assembly factor BamE (lipoprotein component of BamABCDE complex)